MLAGRVHNTAMTVLQQINIAKNLKQALGMLLILKPAATGTMKVVRSSSDWLLQIEQGQVIAVGSNSRQESVTANQILAELLRLDDAVFEFCETESQDEQTLTNLDLKKTNVAVAKILDRKFGEELQQAETNIAKASSESPEQSTSTEDQSSLIVVEAPADSQIENRQTYSDAELAALASGLTLAEIPGNSNYTKEKNEQSSKAGPIAQSSMQASEQDNAFLALDPNLSSADLSDEQKHLLEQLSKITDPAFHEPVQALAEINLPNQDADRRKEELLKQVVIDEQPFEDETLLAALEADIANQNVGQRQEELLKIVSIDDQPFESETVLPPDVDSLVNPQLQSLDSYACQRTAEEQQEEFSKTNPAFEETNTERVCFPTQIDSSLAEQADNVATEESKKSDHILTQTDEAGIKQSGTDDSNESSRQTSMTAEEIAALERLGVKNDKQKIDDELKPQEPPGIDIDRAEDKTASKMAQAGWATTVRTLVRGKSDQADDDAELADHNDRLSPQKILGIGLLFAFCLSVFILPSTIRSSSRTDQAEREMRALIENDVDKTLANDEQYSGETKDGDRSIESPPALSGEYVSAQPNPSGNYNPAGVERRMVPTHSSDPACDSAERHLAEKPDDVPARIQLVKLYLSRNQINKARWHCLRGLKLKSLDKSEKELFWQLFHKMIY